VIVLGICFSCIQKYSFNSKMILDSLNINPINKGVNAGIGLIYMMDEILPYIKEGDIIVISPEYDQFYGNFAYGNSRLLWTLMNFNTYL